jgi:diaminopimelate decarboxylase
MTHTLVYPMNSVHNAAGHLEIDGCDVVDLAAEHGTPVMIYEEKTLRDQCRRYVDAFRSLTDDFEVIYASKAFNTVAMFQLVAEEGLSLDVAGGGEHHTAVAAGFPPERIFYHGNNKTPRELAYALDKGVGYVVLDSLDEIRLLRMLAAERGITQRVLIRVNPGVEAHTHSFIQTGQLDSKFGFSLLGGQAAEAVRLAMEAAELDLVGLHAHIGSQIFDLIDFRKEI